MAVTDPLLLPPDVILVPVAELPPEIRDRLPGKPGDIAIGRQRARASSRLVDAGTAELIAEFRRPATIAEAVVRYSEPRRLDAHATLAGALPVLNSLRQAGFLLPAAAAASHPIAASMDDGDEILGYRVLRCVQVLEDTEVYEVQRSEDLGHFALKLGRDRDGIAALLEREAEVLAALAGTHAPRLCASGRAGGLPYVVMEWCAGANAAQRAAALRRPSADGASAGRRRLLRLCCAILNAYAALHERGVVHGDVHPRNLVVGDDGLVRVIDFGLARLRGATSPPPARGGLTVFFEPEFAAADLRGTPHPPACEHGEQYALGALLHLLLTGEPYLQFELERGQALRQIAEQAPRPLAGRAADSGEIPLWPAQVGAVLARALEKDAKARFESVAAMATALGRAGANALPRPARPLPQAARGSQAAATARLRGRHRAGSATPAAQPLWCTMARRLGAGSRPLAEGLSLAPTASAAAGSAGVAYFFHRLAAHEASPELLATADLWAARALADGASDHGFFSSDLELTERQIGWASLYHQAGGVHHVRALIAAARGDLAALQAAAAAFITASQRACPQWDLASGRAGALLGCAQLHETLRAAATDDGMPACYQGLLSLGNSTLAELWAHLDRLGPIAHSRSSWLGMAHGWAGLLYATLRWCQASATLLPSRAAERLAELAGMARREGRVRWWPRHVAAGQPAGTPWAGWCHGSAGHVFLWSLAHRILAEPGFDALAEGAAWGTWAAGGDPARASANLCCGLAGRAYALLHRYSAGGDRGWLERARLLGEQAVAAADPLHPRAHGIFKGAVGVSLLAADLARPGDARFPLFEPEPA